MYNEEIVRNEMFLALDHYVTESSGHNSEYNWWFRKRPEDVASTPPSTWHLIACISRVATGLIENLARPGGTITDPGLDRYWPEVRRAAGKLDVVPESVEMWSQENLEKGLAITARRRRNAIFVWVDHC